MAKLAEGTFSQAIVNHRFPNLSGEDRNKITNLFDHAFDHPWADEDLKSSIIHNICNEFGIEIPEEFQDEGSEPASRLSGD